MFVWLGRWEEGGSPFSGSSELLYCLCDCWMQELLQWLGGITQALGCCAQPHPEKDMAWQGRRGRSCWSVVLSLTLSLCWYWIASVPALCLDQYPNWHTKITWLHKRKRECTGRAIGERLEPGFGSVLDPGVLSQTCVLGLRFHSRLNWPESVLTQSCSLPMPLLIHVQFCTELILSTN